MSKGKPTRLNKNGYPQEVVPEYHDTYDSVEFDLTTGQTDYNVKLNQGDSFKKVPRAHSMVLRTTKEITIKINTALGDVITISRREGRFTITREMGLEITNVIITNASGATSAIKLLLIP